MFAGALFIKYSMGLTGDAGLYTSILILLAISGFFCIAGGLSGQFLFCLLDSCQAVVKQSSGSRQVVIRQSSGSCQAVFKQSSGSHQAVVKAVIM